MEELCDFFPAQNRRQRTGPFRIGSVSKAPGSAQRLDVKNRSAAKRCATVPGDFPFRNNSA